MLTFKQIFQIAGVVIKAQFTLPVVVDRNALISETIMFVLATLAFTYGYVNVFMSLSFCYLGVILIARFPETKENLGTKYAILTMVLSMFITLVVGVIYIMYPLVLLILTLISMPGYTCRMVAWVKGHVQENTNVLTGH